MRIFPRIGRPSLKPVANRLRRLRRHLTVARVAVCIELVIFSGVLLFAFSGGRAAFIDSFGERSDLVVMILVVGLMAVLHAVVRRHLLPRIERYFSPVRYDERRILFDLGQEARRATDINHLFSLITGQIGEALHATDASLFVRDEATGDYVRRASSLPAAAQPPSNDSPGRDLADGEPGVVASEPSLRLAHDAFVVRRLRTLEQPMEIGPQDFEVWDRFLDSASTAQRITRQKEREALMRIKTRILMPIRSKEKLVGIMSLGECSARHEYDATDKEMLISVGSQLALVIENSRLTERMVADEKLRRELTLAAEVQRRLLPAQAPECAAVELAGFCRPARGVGGDYYDFFKLDNQQVGLAIADVAGKGIAAALQMSTVQATLRSLLSGAATHQSEASPALMVAMLNRLLLKSTGGANYVTFFYAEFDECARRLSYVNAGHNPPILFRTNGVEDFRELSCGGMFVGMFEHCGYEQEIVQMQPGDVLIGFTDGLSEAMNVKGEEFGEARIREALAMTAGQAINEIRDEIARRASNWCAGAPLHDDLTFIILKVK